VADLEVQLLNEPTRDRTEAAPMPGPGAVLKDDYFARTSFEYLDGAPVVVKESKPWRVLGLELSLPARLLARHGARINRQLSEIEGIPGFIRLDGQRRFARRYIPGRTLQEVPQASGAFFDDLERVVRDLHQSGIAYVDLAKQENIIVGEDGRAYLIDFQISLSLGPFSGILKPLRRALFRMLAREDLYHLAKHRSLKARDSMRFEHTFLLSAPSRMNRAHRRVVKPFYNLWTRRLLRRTRTL
jgi:hypothetical protein